VSPPRRIRRAFDFSAAVAAAAAVAPGAVAGTASTAGSAGSRTGFENNNRHRRYACCITSGESQCEHEFIGNITLGATRTRQWLACARRGMISSHPAHRASAHRHQTIHLMIGLYTARPSLLHFQGR
ncbi:unnamed protein product, partial [Ectocarpus sp. 12 AP-2014]